MLTARAAYAAPPRLETPPEITDCPTADELRSAIARQLGRDDFDREGAPIVDVRVRRSDQALAADISVTTTAATTTRTIDDAEACSDLVRAAALSVALAIEKEAEDDSRRPTQSLVKPPSAKDERPLVNPSLRNDRLVLTASGLTSIGLLPRPAPGVGLLARVRISESAWISTRGFVLPEASMPNDAFALRLRGVGAGACVEPFGAVRVSAVGCAHLVGGLFDVTQRNTLMKSADPEPYAAAVLSAGARAQVHGPFHVEGGLDAHLPFVRPTYLTDRCPPTGFEPPFMALALWLGAGISIR